MAKADREKLLKPGPSLINVLGFYRHAEPPAAEPTAESAQTPPDLVARTLASRTTGDDARVLTADWWGAAALIDSIRSSLDKVTFLTPEEIEKIDTAPAWVPQAAKLLLVQGVMNLVRSALAPHVQGALTALEGYRGDSFKTNQDITQIIQSVIDDLKLAIECPQCQQPARLRCRKPGRSKTGVFQFEHTGKTNHGGSSTLPKIKLVDPKHP